MIDESALEKERVEALKQIASALAAINEKLEKVVKKRVRSGVSGPNAEYWVIVTEPQS